MTSSPTPFAATVSPVPKPTPKQMALSLVGPLSPRRIATLIVLIGAWCALWGSASPANLLSGFAVSMLVDRPSIGPAGLGSVRPVALLRLIGVVFVDLVVSTFTVAWEVLTPTDHTEESIIEVRLPSEARAHLLVLVIAITLTPGTAVVDADPDTGTLYLHLLHDEKRAETHRHVARLADLVVAALPVGPELSAASHADESSPPGSTPSESTPEVSP